MAYTDPPFRLPTQTRKTSAKNATKRRRDDTSDNDSLKSDTAKSSTWKKDVRRDKDAKTSPSNGTTDAPPAKAGKAGGSAAAAAKASAAAGADADANTSAASDDGSAGNAEPQTPVRNGFELGLKPMKILGASDASGELMFLMKWDNHDRAELVRAKEANVRCPQMVIAFYEQRLTWHSEEDK